MTKLESLKNKSSGSSLLKFIDRMKVSEKNSNEPDSSTNDNLAQKQSQTSSEELDFRGSHESKSEKNDAQDISLSIENQLLSDEIQFDAQDLNNVDEKSEANNKAIDEASTRAENDMNVKTVTEKHVKHASQLKQTTQSEYFKQIKPSSSNRSSKIKLPDIREIDMKVLIELPEDIRNEILNEYKENKDNENIDNDRTPPITPEKNINKVNVNSNSRLEKDLSFSQIDPDFLAALPDEMKDELKSYINEQKRVKNVQIKDTRPSHSDRGWNMFKNDKTRQKSTKLKSGKLKITRAGGKKEMKSSTFTNNKKIREIVQKPEQNIQTEERKAPVARNASFHFDPSNGNSEHSEILSSLVNCLLDLPISQVVQ